MSQKNEASSPAPLAIEIIEIHSLRADPKNVRQHNQRNLTAIRSSLVKFGQQKPIVIDADNTVIAGNGTVQVARELGWETIAAVRTSLATQDATAFAIADNRTAELAEWNLDGLDLALRELGANAFNLEDIGFSSGDISDLIGKDHWDEAKVTSTDAVYAEKVVVVITDMTYSAPLKKIIQAAIASNGWENGAKIV